MANRRWHCSSGVIALSFLFVAMPCDQGGEPRPDHEDGPMEPCDIGGFELQETAPATATATAIATCTPSWSPTPMPGGYF
jgi:hypothetical protein